MYCEIARKLDDDTMRAIQDLEGELGVTLVAFSCRDVGAEREARLTKMMAGLGPVLLAEPVDPDAAQLARLRETEAALGLSLVAVQG